LKNVPRHNLVLAAVVDLPWSVGAYARYHRAVGAFLDDENTLPIRGPSTFDVRVRRTFHQQTVFVDAVNLANHHYEEYGFTLTDFRGRVVPYAYPGAPRAVRVGMSFTIGAKPEVE
jgi:outer membrane receptor protein involved in Fe transport